MVVAVPLAHTRRVVRRILVVSQVAALLVQVVQALRVLELNSLPAPILMLLHLLLVSLPHLAQVVPKQVAHPVHQINLHR